MAHDRTEGSAATSKRRGFASMDPERQRRIASEGGRAAHAEGTAHQFTSEEARAAGRRGGEVVSQNRAHMREIGRRGGTASSGGRRTQNGLATKSLNGEARPHHERTQEGVVSIETIPHENRNGESAAEHTMRQQSDY